MRRVSADVWFVLALLLLLVFGSYLILRGSHEAGGDEVIPHRSSYNSKSGGLRALYLTLNELGYRVRQNRTDFTRLPERGILLAFEPLHTSPTEREWRSLEKWLAAGNYVLLVSDGRGQGLGLPLGEPEGEGSNVLFPEESKARSVQISPITREVRTVVIRSGYRLSSNDWGPPQNEPGRPMRRRSARRPARRTPAGARPLVTLLRDRMGVVASAGKWGSGGVLLMSSPAAFSNAYVDHADNFRFLLNVLDTWDPQHELPVLFDEFHQGFGDSKGFWSLFSTPVRRAGLQLATAFLLGLICLSCRMGRPLPVAGEGERTRMEYLASMTMFFRRAKAQEAARQALGAEFLREMTRLFTLPPDSPARTIAAAAHEGRGLNFARVHATAAIAQGPHSFASEAEMLKFARDVHAIVEECRKV